MSRKPNIVLIFTDQQRFDTINALGNPVIRTPNLDRLCREGTAFTSAYSPSPVCVPARCSMHYGRYPMHTKCYDNAFPMPEDGRPTFMDALANEGYRTHGIGKCHFTPEKDALRGFQSRETQEECAPQRSDDYTKHLAEEGWGDVPEPHGVRGEMYYVPQVSQMPRRFHPTQWVGDRSVAFVEDQGAEQPWFLFSSFIHPHPPFAPPVPWHKLYRAPLMPLPKLVHDPESLQVFINRHQNRYKFRDQGIDLNLVRNMKAHYYACISFIDYQVGRILTALEAAGQLDNTLILFTSDHGEHLGDYNCFGKRSMHDTCARVPLLARLPGQFAAGERCDRPASLVDVAPTILSAAGCDPDAMATDGVDLRTVSSERCRRETVYSQYRRSDTAIYTLINRRWKYAYSVPDNREFLFDRVQDPLETRNRAGLAFLHEDLERLRRQMQSFLAEGGEEEALDGEAWRAYPRRTVSDDPDEGLLIQDTPGYVLDLPGYSDCV